MLQYDAEHRITSIAHDLESTVQYDSAGRASVSENALEPYEYDGLGHLSYSWLDRYYGLPARQAFLRDAFGNARIEQDWPLNTVPESPGSKWLHTHPNGRGGRLSQSVQEWDFDDLPEPNGWTAGQAGRVYDKDELSSVDETRHTWSYSGSPTGYENASEVTRYRSVAKSYYDASGQMRVHQINRDSLDYREYPDTILAGQPWGVYEEYWYDALGRRILKRSRQEDPVCTYSERCYNSIERFVWDGEQILWELRQPGSGNLDVQKPTAGLYTGHILYVHGAALDAPLGLVRNDTTIILHRNWKGLVTHTTDTGGNQTTCAPNSFTNCQQVTWPGINWDAKHGFVEPRNTEAWYGSLPIDQNDRTGLSYRRNRFYDPASGQFTQSDPIGIAGGLNLYGYAGGDPVNFSDPFGLCLDGITTWACLWAVIEVAGTVADAVDVAVTGARFFGGSATGREFGVTLTGAAAGVFLAGAGYGRAGRQTLEKLPKLDDTGKLHDPIGGLRPP